jgi:hypothetical protein
LTDPSDRAKYRARVLQGLHVGGSLVIAAFSLDGPQKCSGLPTGRYSPESLHLELGWRFRLEEAVPERHETPLGTTQDFWYNRFSLT